MKNRLQNVDISNVKFENWAVFMNTEESYLLQEMKSSEFQETDHEWVW